jgi:hypothetical protein
MAYIIKLDDDITSADELQLMKTKQAILEKLRGRFGEYSNHNGWAAALKANTPEMSNQCSDHTR